MELIEREKRTDETMSAYYYEKLALCERCDIRDEKAVSCLIKGLPEELRANAYAVQCKTPEALFNQFLSGLEDYGKTFRRTTAAVVANRIHRSAVPTKAKAIPAGGTAERAQIQGTQRICYNCQELGTHISRDCPKPRMERCRNCRRGGHVAARCPLERKASNTNVRLVGELDGKYKKLATLESGVKIRVYLDTGTQQNLISKACVDTLALVLIPNNTVLRGFGGGTTVDIGEISLTVSIDGVKLKALVTLCDLAGADLVIGQPGLVQEEVTLVVRKGKVTLACGEDLHEVFRHLTLTEKSNHYVIRLIEAAVIPPITTVMLPVGVEGGRLGETVEILSRVLREQGGLLVFASFVVVVGNEHELGVSNLSKTTIRLKKSRVLARVKRSMAVRTAEAAVVNSVAIIGAGPHIVSEHVGDITIQQKEALEALVGKFTNCFSTQEGDLGITHLGEMTIQLTSNKPICYRPYRLAIAERPTVRNKVEQLLASGVIQESNSDYASPIILVPKKNGEVRLCVDYRALNRITVKDRYPLPVIDDLLDRLAGTKYFTTLDMASDYHQVPMHSNSIHKTAFVTPDGHYEYMRVPFGLANAPSCFSENN